MLQRTNKRGSSAGSDAESDADTMPRPALGDDADPVDVAGLFAGVEAQIARERGVFAFLRARSTRARIAIALVAVGALALLTATRFARADMALYPVPRMVLVLGSIGLLFGFTLWLELRPLQAPAMPAWLARAGVGAALFGMLAVYALPSAHGAHPASLVYGQGLIAQLLRAVPCGLIGLINGGALFMLLLGLDRSAGRRRLLAAASAGLAANFLLQLLCPVTSPIHLVIAHLGVALVLIGVAALPSRAAA